MSSEPIFVPAAEPAPAQHVSSQRRLLRSAAVLGGGTALAQSFNVALAPVMTRLYVPSDFAQFALFSSFVGVALVAMGLQYELSIPSARDERESAQLTLLCITLAGLLSVASAFLMEWGRRRSVLGLGVLPAIAPLLLAPTLFFASSYTTLRYWFIRHERFGGVSRAMVLQSGARALSQTALGAAGAGAPGLLVGEVAGRLAGLTGMFRQAWPALRRSAAGSHPGEFAQVLARNRKFPMYSLPSSFLDSLAGNLSLPLLVYYYGTEAGGQFALLQKVMGVPLVLVGASVADAFHSRIALCARELPGRMATLFHGTAAMLLLLGSLPAVVLLAFGGPLFSFFFGRNWTTAGVLAGIVAPWFLSQFVVSPVSRLVYVLRGQEWKLVYDAVALAGTLTVFAIARVRGWSFLDAVRALSAVNTFAYCVYYLLLLRILARIPRPAKP